MGREARWNNPKRKMLLERRIKDREEKIEEERELEFYGGSKGVASTNNIDDTSAAAAQGNHNKY